MASLAKWMSFRLSERLCLKKRNKMEKQFRGTQAPTCDVTCDDTHRQGFKDADAACKESSGSSGGLCTPSQASQAENTHLPAHSFPTKHKSLPLSLKHLALAATHKEASSLLPAVNPPSAEPVGGLSQSSLGLGLFKEECNAHKGPLLRSLL